LCSRSSGLEPLTDQLDGFGQRTWAEAEGALDQARLANDVARELKMELPPNKRPSIR
jgi:hypothetical protein